MTACKQKADDLVLSSKPAALPACMWFVMLAHAHFSGTVPWSSVRVSRMELGRRWSIFRRSACIPHSEAARVHSWGGGRVPSYVPKKQLSTGSGESQQIPLSSDVASYPGYDCASSEKLKLHLSFRLLKNLLWREKKNIKWNPVAAS